MYRLAFLLVAAALLICPVHAESCRYVVGVENIDHYPHYALEGDDWVGFGRDLLDAFAKTQNCIFEYRPYPVKRLMQEHMTGGVDFRFPDNPLWSENLREGVQVLYSVPFVEVIEGTMVRPEMRGQGLDRFETLGTIIGFTAASYQQAIEQGEVKVDASSNSLQLIKKTLMGRIDGAYLSIDSAQHLLRNVLNKPDELVFDDSLPYDKYAYLLSSTTRPKVIEEFNLFLTQEAEFVSGLISKYSLYVAP